MNITDSLNTFIGAGTTSAIIGYLVNNVDPLIAAILWTFPFTILFPIYNLHKNKKSNKFISNFLKTQSYTLFLLVVFLYSSAYFVDRSSKNESIINPLSKGAGVWLIVSIIYYIIMKMIDSNDKTFKRVLSKDLHIH